MLLSQSTRSYLSWGCPYQFKWTINHRGPFHLSQAGLFHCLDRKSEGIENSFEKCMLYVEKNRAKQQCDSLIN